MTAETPKLPFSFDLSGRTIMITGASSGIGAEIARAICQNGGSVVLAARRKDRLDALHSELEASGGKAAVVEMDVTDEASTKAAFDAAEAAFGELHGLIANAGVDSTSFVTDMEVDEFDRAIAANLRGVYLSVREAGRRMMASGIGEREQGRVVINASFTATSVFSGLSAYSASKAGAVQFGKVTAREWARKGINVNIVCPGYLYSEMTGDFFASEGGKKFSGKFPRGRVMDKDALNGIMLYLVSDASQFVTGSVFQIDDGQSL